MNAISESKNAGKKQRYKTLKKDKMPEIPETFAKLMEKEFSIKYHQGTKDQAKYVKSKINEADDLMWSEFLNLKNIPDDTKQKILGTYKKINVKPFKQEEDVKLEDVEGL